MSMSDPTNNRVRPVVRFLSAVFGAAFALFGLIGLAMLAVAIWTGVRTGHFSGKQLLIGVVVPLSGYSIGSLFLAVAWTGMNPRLDDDEPPNHESPAV
jgi:hypothetical protein